MQQDLINNFVERERIKHEEKGKGNYLHFDNRLKLTPSLISYVTMPQNIVRHSFYPFIHSLISIKRYDRETRTIKTKDRDIHYAAHLDSLIYSWYSVLIADKLEKKLIQQHLTENVIAYRKIKIRNESAGNTHFAVQVFDFIKDFGECTVLAFDIHHFFDNIDHVLLKKYWSELLELPELPVDHYRIYRSLTKFAFVDRSKIIRKLHIKLGRGLLIKRFCTTKDFDKVIRPLIKRNEEVFGIPQGSPISALLSNVYLNEFDYKVKSSLGDEGGLYRRYSDDIIIVCKKEHTDQTFELISSLLAAYKLKINDKTEVVVFKREGERLVVDAKHSNRSKLQYLGYEFDGQNYYIRSSSLARYFRKMKKGVRVAFAKKIKNKQGDKVYLRSVYEKYTHLGKTNFISYAKRAYTITGSQTINRQIKRHWRKIKQEIDKRRGKI